MTEITTKTITLELSSSGDGLSGRALDGSGQVREFSGRLGLMQTIDELLAAKSDGNEEDA